MSGLAGLSLQDQAVGLIQSGHSKQAAQLLSEAVQRTPADANLWNLLGIADTEAGDLLGARKAFERGLSMAPSSIELNENIGLLYFRQMDYIKAKRYLVKAVTLGSDNPGVLFSLAAANLRTGEQSEALHSLLALEPVLNGKSDYWEELGRAELVTDPKAAAQSFDRALSLTPDNVSCLNEAAAAAEKEKLDERALAYLIRARALAPENVPTLLHFGSVCIRRDLGLDAVSALQKAYSLDPKSNSALYLLARANVSLQNWQAAFDLFSKLSQRVPRYAPADYAMGWLDIQLGRLDQARRNLKNALALDKQMAGAQYELAELELNDGRVELAENLLRQVLATNPHDARANVSLGNIMSRKGEIDQAEELFRAAIVDDPKLAAAHYQLAAVLTRRHEDERAAQEREIAAKLNQEAKQASKTQLRLLLPDSDTVH